MNRRNFITLAAAIPFGGTVLGKPIVGHTFLPEFSFSSLDSPQIVEFTKTGLLLNNGFIFHWPNDETGVVLLSDNKGKVVHEWRENSVEYSHLMDVFRQFPAPLDIVQLPWLRVIRFQRGS